MWLVLNKNLILLFLLVLREPGHHIMEEAWWCGDAQGQGVEDKFSPMTGMEEPSDIAKLRHRLRGLSHLWPRPAKRGLSIPGPASRWCSVHEHNSGPVISEAGSCQPDSSLSSQPGNSHFIQPSWAGWGPEGWLGSPWELYIVGTCLTGTTLAGWQMNLEERGTSGPRIQSSLDVRWGWWTQRWFQKACQYLLT